MSHSHSYPPDTDTPMFREENKIKPPVAKIISESGGVVAADDVARGIVAGLIRWRFGLFGNFDGEVLGTFHPKL